MRAALYARVSTDKQSAGMQLDDLRATATQRGWTVAVEAIDVGSGARSDLPERARVLDLARRGRIDVVAVWRLDRLGRSVRDLLDASDSLRRAGVELISLRDAIETATPAGRLVFTVLGAVAELEREVIGERVRAGLQRAKREGTRLGRPRRELDLDRARGLLATGASMRSTAKALGVSARTLRRALDAAQTPPRAGSDSREDHERAPHAQTRGTR